MYYTYELLDQAFAKNWQKTDQKIGENSPKTGKQLAKTGRKMAKNWPNCDQTGHSSQFALLVFNIV